MKNDENLPHQGQFLLYTTEDGRQRIEVRLQEETAWLSQAAMTELFQTTKQNISLHLKNIFAEGELEANRVVKEYLTTAADGKKYRTKFYNLDAIIAVGYRVRSHRGTQFRQWATERLREFIVKGFVLDDERLKEPGGIDYFDDNKLHFAISGKTAAELISERADAAKPNMGLTSWKGAKVRLRDVTIAKNYLNEKELEGLNRVVTMYLDYAEDQAKRHRHIFMRDWREKLDAFLQFNERDILTNAGKMSKAVADSLALEQYDRFNQQRLYQEAEREALEDDRELQQIKQNLEDRLTGGRNKK